MGEHLVPGPLGEGLPGLAPADSQPCLSTATTNGETGFPSGLPGSDSTGVSVLLLLGKLSPPHPGRFSASLWLTETWAQNSPGSVSLSSWLPSFREFWVCHGAEKVVLTRACSVACRGYEPMHVCEHMCVPTCALLPRPSGWEPQSPAAPVQRSVRQEPRTESSSCPMQRCPSEASTRLGRPPSVSRTTDPRLAGGT